MFSKHFFIKTQTLLLSILLIFSVFSMSIIYQATSVFLDNEFLQYKKAYFTEQTYKLSYFLSVNVKDSLHAEENYKIYDNLSREFSIRFELLTKDLDEVIYHTTINNTKAEEEYVVNVPVISNGIVQGEIRAYFDINSQVISPALTKHQSNTKNQLVLITVLLSILLVISSFVISKVLSKPIEKASKAVLQVLRGNRERHIPRSGTVEIRYLIDGINSVLIEFNNMENWRKQMMEDLTHELRTPLTSVLMMMEAIIDGVYQPNGKNLQDIYDEVERLSRLIINVQNLSEAESAQFKLNIKKVNLINLIKGTYEGFLFVAKQKNIKLQFKYPNKPCIVEIDPDRFIQVITNIISNALKYTPEKGTVEIGIEFFTNEVTFYCLDNGIGISEEDQLLVFNRFYRVEKSRSRENGGSGIGLNVSNALVQAQGLDIGVTSKLGEGSRFWVKIPLDTNIDKH